MRKKIIAQLLAFVMAAALLSGCSNGAQQTETTTEKQEEAVTTEEAATLEDAGTSEEAVTTEDSSKAESTGDTADSYVCQLIGTVTDGGQVVSALTIDFGEAKKVTGVDLDTFTVHATASTAAFREGTELESYGDYDIDRTIVKTEDGQKVTLYFNMGEGATLAYTSGSRNYPADLTYTITQNKPVTLTAADGTVLDEAYMAAFTCDNTVQDPETAKFTAVTVEDGINYQFYDAGSDKLVVWFHGNGEGDLMQSGNNVAQMLANRGTVAWATDEFQTILGGASVMAFQAPDTWYYAQKDGLLDKAAEEILAAAEEHGISPDKIIASGCSAGGYMTTRMIIAHPDLFQAAIINCPAYNVATDRGGETPTDEELAAVKESGVPIWLVQGRTDSVVTTEECSQRLFNILTEGAEITETAVSQELEQYSDFTTYETADGKYKLSLYDTTEEDKLRFAEDYDQNGEWEEVQYSSHFSWIYSLLNNPQAADGTKVVDWAAGFVK